MMTDELFATLHVVVGIVFSWAGFSKLREPGNFWRSLGDYQLLPLWSHLPAAVFVIGMEVFIGTSLLFGMFTPAIYWLAMLTLALLASVVMATLVKGKKVKCLCFGGGATEMISTRTLIRIVAIIGAVCILVAGDKWLGHSWSLMDSTWTELISVISTSLLVLALSAWALMIPEVLKLLTRVNL
jgi:hypothetical protein